MMELMKYTDFFPFPQEKLNPLHFGVLRANRSKQQPLDLHAPQCAQQGRHSRPNNYLLERLAAAEGGGANLVLAY